MSGVIAGRKSTPAVPRTSLLAAALATLFVLATAGQSLAATRFYFIDQEDWGANRGFYVDVEGSKLATLPLILGIGDGHGWQFVRGAPALKPGQSYAVRAVLGPKGAELFLDGKSLGKLDAAFVPADQPCHIAETPGWASDRGDYILLQNSLRVAVQRKGKAVAGIDKTLDTGVSKNLPLYLFQPDNSQTATLALKPGDTVTVNFTFRVETVNLQAMSPFIDKYGQCRYAHYPTKITSDDVLRGDIAREAGLLATMPPSMDYDKYGGYLRAGWNEKATGFFRVTQVGGRWWLISPDGNPCFYLGCCSVPSQTWPTTPVTGRESLFAWTPPKTGPMAAAWSANQWGINDGTQYLCFNVVNLIRKYGPTDWSQRAVEQARKRLAAWGFNGGGKWGAPANMVQCPVLSDWSTPKLIDHPDVFDPAVVAAFRKDIDNQVSAGRNNPYILGWSLGNENEEEIKRSEVEQIMKKPATTPAKRALMDYAVDHIYGGDLAKLAKAWHVTAADRDALFATEPAPPAADVEAMREFYEDRYYALAYATVKLADPNHLYLGNWIVPGWWESPQDWLIIARHCDVIGYDQYTIEQDDATTRRLKREANKPTLIGEFSYPPFYGGRRGFGRYGVYGKDERDSGDMYYHRIQEASQDPYCVGALWFQYRDQPLTGRGPGHGMKLTFGEHYAFGLITSTDQPKWDMVKRMREANLAAVGWRLEGHTPTAEEGGR